MAATVTPFCSTEQAAIIAAKVMSLASHFTMRGRGLSTLGTAAYLDAPPDSVEVSSVADGQYDRERVRTNTVLREHFSDLLEDVLVSLGTTLNAPVEYAPDKALPGFHVFEYARENSIASTHVPHFDRQYETLAWSDKQDYRSAQTLSFTLPLRLPASGGGLIVWDVFLQDVMMMGKEASKAHIKQANRQLVKYETGHLVCHSGHDMHMICPWRAAEDEQRITLQGHAIKVGNDWLAYW